MCLLVVHDMARMPRTRAALSGTDPGRPWDEIHGQLALLDTRMQALYGLLWVGLRIKGKAPEIRPYPVPAVKGRGEQDAKAAPSKRRPDPRKMAYLERFAPPGRRKQHLTLVKEPPKPD